MYNLEILLRYSHSFLRYWPWNLLPRSASYRYKRRGEYSKPICDCRWNSFISHNLPRTFQFWNNQSPHLQYIDFDNSRKRVPFSTSGDLTNQTEIETWEYQADVPWATDYDRFVSTLLDTKWPNLSYGNFKLQPKLDLLLDLLTSPMGATSTWHITCTTTHPHLYICEMFV